MTTTIRHDDLVESIAAALQYISYYHPADYIAHLARAYASEQSPAAKDAIAQILTNSKMCAEGRRPICQDTGIVNVFLKIGMDVRFEGFKGSLEDAINEGVRRGYLNADNTLRASIVADPQFERKNTKDNTPAVVHMTVVPGNTVDVQVAAKGGGSENKSKFVMLNPERQPGRLGHEDGADDGRRLVPAGHAGHRHRRHRREGDADGQGDPDGSDRHVRAEGTRPAEQDRGTAHPAVRPDQCARHRRAGTGWADHGTRREDRDVPDACRQQAGGNDPQLRGDPPCALRARRLRRGGKRSAEAIRAHPVVIVCGETGSGKTTQLPKIVLSLGRGKGAGGKVMGGTAFAAWVERTRGGDVIGPSCKIDHYFKAPR